MDQGLPNDAIESAAWLADMLDRLGMTQADLAKRMISAGDDRQVEAVQRSIQRMASGKVRVSGELRALLGLLSEAGVGQRLVEFYDLCGTGRVRRADRSAAGYLPNRAVRFCDAVTSATGYGYLVFPPMDFRLIWDGEAIFWSRGEVEKWEPLSATDSGAVQLPGFAAQFDRELPELAGYSPPFLTALPEIGGVQIWSGFIAKTRPGWSLSIRRPINLPPQAGLETWDGVVETDLWFGPLFSNFRLTRTDFPVVFRTGVPMLQVQPVPQVAYRDDTLTDFTVEGATAIQPSDLLKLRSVLLPDPDHEARQGQYSVMVRKRRLCPYNPNVIV